MARTIEVPAEILIEDIVEIHEIPGVLVEVIVQRGKNIQRNVEKSKGDGTTEQLVVEEFVPSAPRISYIIKDDDIKELLSSKPSWAPNKPSGTYRNEDLWHFIDKFKA